MSNSETQICFGRPISQLVYGDEAAKSPPPEPEEVQQLRQDLAEKELLLKQLRAECQELESRCKQEKQRVDALVEELSTLLDEVRDSKAQLIEDSEEELVGFCLHLTEKVLQHEIEHGRYKIGKVLESALRTVRDSSKVIVRVNPGDHKKAREALKLIEQRWDDGELEVTDDEEVARASCHIETESGTIISNITGRLEKIEQELMKQGNRPDA